MDVSATFYADLNVHKMSLGALLAREEFFCDVPQDWTVIITDLRDSTTAVFSGRHETVNLLATGSIVAVLNLAFKMGVSVPFFFGGDGATFIVPPQLCEAAMTALFAYKQQTRENFGLDLRVGKVYMHEISTHGHFVRLSRFATSSVFSIPVVVGDGLLYAEQIIKGPDYISDSTASSLSSPDLSGMRCRWDRIAPPENKEEVVSLLVIATNVAHQPQLFAQILDKIDALYGLPQKRQPISVQKLRVQSTFAKLQTEMRARIGKIRLFELLREKLVSMYVFLYLRSMKGRTYLEKLVQMSDTLVLDGKISTVISGNAAQREALICFLDEMESAGGIRYGIFVSKASIMSCYVRDIDDGHIHFVDGSEGGYTQAAKMLKEKLAH